MIQLTQEEFEALSRCDWDSTQYPHTTILARPEWRAHWSDSSVRRFFSDGTLAMGVEQATWKYSDGTESTRWQMYGGHMGEGHTLLPDFAPQWIDHEDFEFWSVVRSEPLTTMGIWAVENVQVDVALNPTWLLDLCGYESAEAMVRERMSKKHRDNVLRAARKLPRLNARPLTFCLAMEFAHNLSARYGQDSSFHQVEGRVDKLLAMPIALPDWKFDLVEIADDNGGALGQAIVATFGLESVYMASWHHRQNFVKDALVLGVIDTAIKHGSWLLNLMSTASSWKRMWGSYMRTQYRYTTFGPEVL